jgi:uncharacterized membrane protein
MSTNVFVPKVKPEHVISFGDAIFAFAITLMTLSIDIPDLPANLTELRVTLSVLQSLQSSGFHIIRFSILSKNLISQWFT